MMRKYFYAVWDWWANRHPFLRFLLVIVPLAAVALLAGKPVWRAFKGWRMDRNLAAAKVAVKETRMADARDLSLTVLRSGDPSIEAYRILEKSTGALRDPRHPEIARALMLLPESSASDRWNGFRAVAREMPLGLAGQAWQGLPDEAKRDPKFAAAFAERLTTEGHFAEASTVLSGVPEAARDGAVKRGLVRVLILSGRREGFDEAQRMIATNFPKDGKDAEEWLDLLEKIPPVSLKLELLAPVREALERGGENASARDALVLARLDYAGNFSKRAAVIDAAVERWRETDPGPLAKFLADLGLLSRLAEVFPNELATTHPELLPPLLHALEETGDWQRAGELLDLAGDPLPRYELLAQRAVTAAGAGDNAARVSEWNGAMEEAKSQPSSTAYLALRRIAEAAGMRDEAEQALLEAIRTGRGPLPLYADLKPLLESLSARNRENTLLEVFSIYLPLEPGNPVLLTQYAYLACLNRLATPETVVQAMKPLAAAFPKEMPIQCVLAAALLADGKPADAAAALDPLELKPEQLAPGYRAVFYAVQVANERIGKDDPRITGFPWQDLQPSERKEFGKWLRK